MDAFGGADSLVRIPGIVEPSLVLAPWGRSVTALCNPLGYHYLSPFF